MRTTTLIGSLFLTALLLAPGSVAMSAQPLLAPEIHCGDPEPNSTLEDAVDTAQAAACLVRAFVQAEIIRANDDINEALGAIDPFLLAAKSICENRIGAGNCGFIDTIRNLEIDPNVFTPALDDDFQLASLRLLDQDADLPEFNA